MYPDTDFFSVCTAIITRDVPKTPRFVDIHITVRVHGDDEDATTMEKSTRASLEDEREGRRGVADGPTSKLVRSPAGNLARDTPCMEAQLRAR